MQVPGIIDSSDEVPPFGDVTLGQQKRLRSKTTTAEKEEPVRPFEPNQAEGRLLQSTCSSFEITSTQISGAEACYFATALPDEYSDAGPGDYGLYDRLVLPSAGGEVGARAIIALLF